MAPSNVIFNKTASSFRLSLTGKANEYNEKTMTWSTSISSFKCAFQTLNGDEVQTPEGKMVIASHVIYCLSGINIKPGDRISFGNRLYDVSFVSNESSRDNHFKLYLNQVTSI